MVGIPMSGGSLPHSRHHDFANAAIPARASAPPTTGWDTAPISEHGNALRISAGVPESVLVNYLGAFGTGRVSPRSAGNRSSRGAWPVVEPALGDFGIFGANASAG
jgi:hypothetical protein